LISFEIFLVKTFDLFIIKTGQQNYDQLLAKLKTLLKTLLLLSLDFKSVCFCKLNSPSDVT